MLQSSRFFRTTAFQLVIAASLLFIVLTIVAMFVYAGGTASAPQNPGYSFFTNFFSDLGRTVAHNGQPNTLSSALFTIALIGAGSGLILFFIAFTQFFHTPRRQRLLSLIGSALGVGAGICFIGVALTPANISGAQHGQFVLWAFGLFPIAVLCYIPVILWRDEYPNRYAWSFVLFAALLILYFVLIRFGPSASTPEGLQIQATGQKIIVYASIVSIIFQSFGALQVNATRPTRADQTASAVA